MKAVQLLVNSYLPEDIRDYSSTYDASTLNRLLARVASEYPDRFADILQKVSDLGRKASWLQGETITLQDLAPVIDKPAVFSRMEEEIAALPRDGSFKQRRQEIFQKYNTLIEKETARNALASRNNIAMSVLSGARGKNPQLKAMISTPGTFSDYKGRPIDIFSRESFAEGIRPATFLASTYGARSSVISTKCHEYQTLVRMADLSVKRICDIRVGEYVLGADNKGRVFPVKVLNVFDQGMQDCYRYHYKFSSTRSGINDIYTDNTENHKFLMVSAREYRRQRSLWQRGNGSRPDPARQHDLETLPASRMSKGARCSSFNPVCVQGGYSGEKEEPWALMLGLLIGDGCLVQTSVTLSCADETLIHDVEAEVHSLGQKLCKTNDDTYSWRLTAAHYSPLDNNSIEKGVQGFVKGRKCARNQMLEDYGLLGHYAWEKRFPVGWQQWNKQSIARLVAGLFAADGSVFETKQRVGKRGRTQVSISFGVTSLHLLEDLKLALQMYFGVSSRLEREVTKGGFGSTEEERVHPLHALEISRAEDVLLFEKEISKYVPGVKRAKLQELVKKITIRQQNPYGKFMYQGKEHLGMAHCFDIEVDHPDHLFVLANGLITSNSSTAKGGDWAKQMASVAADLVVRKEDCGSHNGLSYAIDDSSLKGRALAKETAGIPAGTFIDRTVLKKLEKAGVKKVVARSPITCNVPNGLCAHCVGKFYNGGKLPKVGDAIGLLSSSTVGEPVCLAKGTLVRMADGTAKAIEDIAPGDMVLGSDEKAHCTPVKVVNVFHNGMRDCYRTGVKKGRGATSEIVYLESTLAHKTLSCVTSRNRGLACATPCIRPIGELPTMQSHKLMCQFPVSYEGGRPEPFAMLLGMLIGDGSYKGTASGSARVGVRLSCYDDDQVEVLRKNIAPLKLRVQSYTTAHEYRIVAEDQYDKSQWTYDKYGGYIRNKVRAKLIEEGMWGQDCYTKTLPKSIWEWDHVSVCDFVGGLIATDGYINKDSHGVGYSSNNKVLLQQIQLLLETRLGVYSTRIVGKIKKKEDGTAYNPTYEFAITEASSIKRLAEQVAVPGRKDALLKKAAERHAKSKLGLFTAVSQEHLGMCDTYDIEVDSASHLFVLANGMIVSNTQMALSAKHTAGMTQGKRSYSGLEYIQQFTQSPEAFKDRAAVSEKDGTVESVEEAPQGGLYVVVDGEKHYVPHGHEAVVREGDTVEAGDQLSEGLIDPEDIVRLKGLGEGRKYYAERLHQMLADSGAATDKRNAEVLARAALRHIRITDPEGMGVYLPDDIADYNAVQTSYRPPETARIMGSKEAIGKYLQQPVMHFSIGTRVTPKVSKELVDNGYNDVWADDYAPSFEPELVRLRTASHTTRDWLASLGTSYLAKQLNESATRGDDTNILENDDFRPRLAVGVGFGHNVRETGKF